MITFNRGTLYNKMRRHKVLQEIVFGGEPSPLKEVEIVTLKQALYDLAISEAWEINPNPNTVDQTSHMLLRTKFNSIREFVEISEEKITVGINAPIVDDSIVDVALMLLFRVDDITTIGITYFGEEVPQVDLL